MNILHLEHERYSTEALARLSASHELELFSCVNQEALYQKLAATQYDAIFTRIGLMLDETSLAQQHKIKYIVTPTTGLNHIDLTYAGKRKISITSLKGEAEFLASIKSTAEHAWALLMNLTRRVVPSFRSVASGHWVRNPFLCDELDEKKIGIIGFGRLGKIVAQYAGAFGMHVMAYDVRPVQNDKVQWVTLDTLLREADVVMLLITWSPDNEQFMNRDRFQMMKEGAYFINVSRGELIDETALLEGLRSGRIRAAGLDVLANDSAWDEHVEDTAGLVQYACEHDNLVITPHIGGYGKDSILRTRDFITDKFLKLTNS